MSKPKITQLEIAKEHGMSFIAVVRSYAEAGHSIYDTAQILGRSTCAFRRLCQRQGWVDWFPKNQDSIAAKQAKERRRGTESEASKAVRAKANAVLFERHAFEYRGALDTKAGHARRHGIPYRTVCSRLHARPGDYDHAFSRRSHVKPPGTHGHRWRSPE